MTWRKFFKPVNSVLPASQRAVDSTSAYASTSKYSNWLPEVYSGPPDRLQRYAVYDQMTYDHEISAALDTIADFGSEPDEVTKQPLLLKYNDDPTPSETLILEKTLSQWLRLNELNRRLWRIFRSTLVYGDQFFLRDPETFKLYWIDPAKVEKVIVNESDGKKIESYFVKEIDLNMKSLVATNQLNKSSNAAFGSNSIVFSPPMAGNVNYISGGFGGAGSANYQDGSATPVDAEHIVQISLTDGMNAAWPFGISILETIYKIYKQKELLEDAILIYRVHRAPERRVFFIDVGTMPPNKAQQYLERVRYEVQQKRIPSRTGGGCFSMDTKVPLLDGRVLTITELSDEYAAGKQNWAYSCNPTTGEMVPGLITWAGVTQKQAKVMKLTLDNGETVICTPEHKFPVIGKGKIEAKDIVVGEDSLFSFNTREYGINRQGKGSAYHKVISAEYLDDKMEVGTLTIDGDEKYHNYHTFAIDQGVYTFNSNVVDSTYNPMCITLDTRIPLLDGRTLPLSDLIAEYKNGKENWAYSADPVTGKIVPGIISWAGVTRKNADIIKITLDNGEILRCTPDHKIPVLGKGFVEAKDLTVHDPLVSFETRKVSLSKDKDRSYEQIFDHKTNQWHFTHRMVANYFKELNKHQEFTFNEECAADIKDTVHHKDYDRYNNSPINLQWMNRHDHTLYHSFVKKEYWENISPVELNRIKSKIRAGLSKYRLENPDWKKMYETRDISWIADMKDNNPEKYVSWRQSHGKSLSNFYKAGSDKALELKAHAAFNMLKNKANNQTLNFTQPMLTRLVEIVKKHNSDRIDTINLVNSDIKFMQLLKESNPILVNSTHNVKNNKFTNSKLERMYDKFGYKNWKDFKKNIQQYNHRITSIELLSETEDVGTITIDGKEKFHNFHTFAIESGIFVKNSILEDYFFAVTSEGRGSKVEVLPGGENLGDIDDLRYFNNKMLRALGVPSSYLPTGPEDGTAAVSDGRVGAAFIQEHRFSKVVARYQQQVIMPIDLEFKLFLKHRGISIDNSLFELEFTPPQSFSDYRKLELDSARINTFTALMDIPYVSKRFILKEYLGWTEAQLAENERMWKEERSRLTKTFAAEPMGGGSAPAGLSDVGITSSGIDDMSPEGGEEDMTGMEDPGVSDNEVDSFGQ